MRHGRTRAAQLIAAILVCVSSALAQTSWVRTYGGTDDDYAQSVRQTSNGGYVIGGVTKSFGTGTPRYANVYFMKTNSSGDTLRTRSYGGTGDDYGYSVQQTSDEGYVIAGATTSFGAGGNDVYLIRTDVSTDTLWTRTYGGTNDDFGYSVRQTSDGGYIIAGSTCSFGPGTPDSSNVYLVKTNPSGDTLWTRIYGGTGDDYGYAVQQTLDGGYIIAGQTASFGAGDWDIYLIKTDASGDTLWTRVYGGTHNDYGQSVQPTSEGGYIIAGHTMSFGAGAPDYRNVYLIKTSASGDALWTRTYGGTGNDYGYSVQPTSDGGYIIAGSTLVNGSRYYEVYLIRTNGSGDTLWTRTFGGDDYDCGNSVQQTSDGGYIIAGCRSYFSSWGRDVYLIKTDANGRVAVEEPSSFQLTNPRAALEVQPNPFSSFAKVPGHETERFTLSDLSGRKVGTCKGNRVGERLAPGVYFLSPAKPAAPNTRPLRIVKGS